MVKSTLGTMDISTLVAFDRDKTTAYIQPDDPTIKRGTVLTLSTATGGTVHYEVTRRYKLQRNNQVRVWLTVLDD